MALSRFDNIIAIRSDSGRVVGFHARNLQVATLDQVVWEALQNPEGADTEAKADILEWNQEVDGAATDIIPASSIRTIYVNVAQICNMRCSYCAAGGDGTFGSKEPHIETEKLKSQINFLLAKVPAGATFAISFFGGEPLIYPETIKRVAEYARQEAHGRAIDLQFDITTNGTLVTPKVAEMLADLGATVKVSIDAAPEENDKVRKLMSGRGSSVLALRGLENLIKVKDRLGALATNSVFGPHNTDVVATYQFLKNYDLDYLRFDYAAGSEDETYSPAYIKSMIETARLAWEAGGEKELRRISFFDNIFKTIDSQRRVLNHCTAGKSSLQVDTKGRFFPCVWSAKSAEEEVGRDLELDQTALAKYQASLIELNNCNNCWARHLCGGGCMYVNKIRNGHHHSKDEQFCNRTRALIAKGIEYYEQSRYERREEV